MTVDPRFLKEEGAEVFTGNELLIKGALEAEGGTHLLTGYPGSPIAGFFDAMELVAPLYKSKGIRACIANNEALGAAMLNGLQMGPLRGICAMKSVGLHVATDALALGNLAGAHPQGGALVIIGDDPWSDSTQVPADSRYLCKHIFMPVMEPSSNQEIKDWIDLGFKLSRESNLFIGYLVTTNQADGGGSVQVRPNQYPDVNTINKYSLDTARIDLENTVLLPPRTWTKEAGMPQRYARLFEGARRHGANRIINPRENPRWRAEIGFVASGLGFCYLEHALAELGVADQVPILKLGVSYPIDPELVEEFTRQVRSIFVIEERRGFMEEQVAEIVGKLNQHAIAANRTNVWGKEFPVGLTGIPATRGLNPSILIQRLAPLAGFFHDPNLVLDEERIDCAVKLIRETDKFDIRIPLRTPTFCPGCPHRDSASVLIEMKKQFIDPRYMKQHHQRGPVDLVFHGDTGCYTMLMFEPTKDLMHNYSGMGLGGGTGGGIDPFITNKQVVFLGDSTFFHSGMLGISNALKQGQDIAYVILDNATTAMTGHQPTPSMDVDIVGDHTYKQNIDGIVEAMLGQGVHVVRANPAYRESWKKMLEETILRDGVKVIVADKECGITYHRRESREERQTIREKGFLPEKQFVNINPDVCEDCLECTMATGCPGLTIAETPFGAKIQTDLSWCVADTACTKIYACPSFEEITIVRTQKPPAPIDSIDLTDIPLPQVADFKDVWHCYLAGVGGQGIGVSTATIVRAGFKQGYHVLFCDKKGLAIRNGGVFSQITFTKGPHHTSNIIPYGQADLLLGIDPLEAVRSLSPQGNLRVGSPAHTVAVVNAYKTPTILTLLGKDDFSVAELEETLRRYTKSDEYFGLNVAGISEHFFGTKLYANVVLLGVAFQRGQLPLSFENIEWGLRETMGSAAADNIKAFHLGRKLVFEPELAHKHELRETYEQFIAERKHVLRRNHRAGERWSREFEVLIRRARNSIRLGELTDRDIVWRLYDLLEYGGVGAYAGFYLDLVEKVLAKDSGQFDFAATKAVIWNLHKAMVIKDEVYVAHLLTSEEKTRRDHHRYHVDEDRGDKIIYHHLNRPEFNVFGRDVRFKFSPKKWQLNMLKHLRWLRRVMPQWHRREREFRDWYIRIVGNFHYADRAGYDRYVKALRCVEEVRGYREVRYPKMDEAKRKAESILAQSTRTKPVSVRV
ncbi:MAG TPA: 2-oxoacid:acceptor oxidoreductase family protein [Verrucomicrobiae bacterium]|nr:2-oxoacid:acceptor oxidoreductase family protein [Verrucomicrobiae bacterium]